MTARRVHVCRQPTADTYDQLRTDPGSGYRHLVVFLFAQAFPTLVSSLFSLDGQGYLAEVD